MFIELFRLIVCDCSWGLLNDLMTLLISVVREFENCGKIAPSDPAGY